MDRIVIEVEDGIARKWRNTDPKFRQEISQKLDQVLSVIFEKKTEDIWPFLENLRIKSEGRGFNDDILEQILNEK
ncbi:hypothetical protein [Dyadobacter fanqingshengii]|uniref:Uncharacterized protein n=1 Tax=Dyadobacter fanqingshengii TaxID=2906443 RepID=A0A9X1PE13_9BACT|nr:hypothetical protein [Dyadobacter fanqingshengii]MCF0042847.1 hypothetical protein [Dyadobacter fanqingshengii]MCF0043471.1 hypothetical protein [Dyadobacter fanqingshengii]USJ35935.1 hypothetical protein NFI81_25030 [Dyadobacter fanqingshengii]